MDDFAFQIGPLLLRLNEFAYSVRIKALDCTSGDDLSRRRLTVVLLVRDLADTLCAESAASALQKKAVQEAVLSAVGLKTDISAAQYEKRLDAFLAEHGSKGLMQLFLEAYLNAVAWFSLAEALKDTSVSLYKTKQLLREINAVSNRRVQSLTARWRLWPKLDSGRADMVNAALQEFLFAESGLIVKCRDFIRSDLSGMST